MRDKTGQHNLPRQQSNDSKVFDNAPAPEMENLDYKKTHKKGGNKCKLVPFKDAGHDFFNGSFFCKRNNDKAFDKTLKETVSFLIEIGILNKQKSYK